MLDKPEMVINTTPIPSLIAATGSCDVLQLLYSRVWVPYEVCSEVLNGGTYGLGVAEFNSAQFLFKQLKPVVISALLNNSLDIGEASVIQTALSN